MLNNSTLTPPHVEQCQQTLHDSAPPTRVVESKCTDFPVGQRVLVAAGWRDKAVVTPSEKPGGAPVVPIPADSPVSGSHYLGVVGMTGLTAYCAVHDIMQPKKGDAMVVSGAAGAVGSVVGQVSGAYPQGTWGRGPSVSQGKMEVIVYHSTGRNAVMTSLSGNSVIYVTDMMRRKSFS